MSRKKSPKGLTWFVNHESDEYFFAEQDYLGHQFAYYENNFEGVKGDDFAKEALYHHDPTKQMKACRGDVFEERTCAWHRIYDKFVNVNDESGDGADVLGTSMRYYVTLNPKYYNKI